MDIAGRYDYWFELVLKEKNGSITSKEQDVLNNARRDYAGIQRFCEKMENSKEGEYQKILEEANLERADFTVEYNVSMRLLGFKNLKKSRKEDKEG